MDQQMQPLGNGAAPLGQQLGQAAAAAGAPGAAAAPAPGQAITSGQQAPVQAPAEQPAPPQARQGTLEEYAAGIHSTDFDLQRQTDAFNYFRTVVGQLRAVAQDPNANVGELPFITFTYPTTDGEAPGEFKLDLGTLNPQVLVQFESLFAMVAAEVADNVMQAWMNINEITNNAMQIVAQARSQRAAQCPTQ